MYVAYFPSSVCFLTLIELNIAVLFSQVNAADFEGVLWYGQLIVEMELKQCFSFTLCEKAAQRQSCLNASCAHAIDNSISQRDFGLYFLCLHYWM